MVADAPLVKFVDTEVKSVQPPDPAPEALFIDPWNGARRPRKYYVPFKYSTGRLLGSSSFDICGKLILAFCDEHCADGFGGASVAGGGGAQIGSSPGTVFDCLFL